MAKSESRLADELTKVGARLNRVLHPVGLTDDELRASGRRRDASTPIPVAAWVLHQVLATEAQLVKAEAIAWTDDAAWCAGPLQTARSNIGHGSGQAL